MTEMADRHGLSVEWVNARGDKATRARPVAALYEAGLVEHAPGLEALETELLLWEPARSRSSPNRLDALVHLVDTLRLGGGGRGRAYSAYDV